MKRALLLTISMISFSFALYTAITVYSIKKNRKRTAEPAGKISIPAPPVKQAKVPPPQTDPFSDDTDRPAAGYGIHMTKGELKKGELYNSDRTLQRVPVLCYHRIDKGKRDNYYSIRKNFIWQMRYLAAHHNVISTGHLVDYIRYRQGVSSRKITIPEKAVVIQFDDNYKSVYRIAYPILKKLGLKWTFFIYKHHHNPNPRAHLLEMARNGVDIQSHTMTHPWFHKPARGQSMKAYIREMHWQVGGSKKYLQKLSGRPVLYLAYPFGTYSDLAVAMCKRYGYRGMFAADGGYATEKSPLHAIERILVTKGWSKSYFKKVVEGRMSYRKQFTPTRILSPGQAAKILGKPAL